MDPQGDLRKMPTQLITGQIRATGNQFHHLVLKQILKAGFFHHLPTT